MNRIKPEFIDDIKAAEKVLELEAEGLNALSKSLDENFVKAVKLLDEVKGRVVVTGMGKSGLIGRKIAATLASTGTPAFFVHPGEASHGDLGMVAPDDLVIALSNSGETTELRDILAYSMRFDIPLVAIIGRKDSTLGNRASAALVMPEEPEACPLGLAPTTSTTMMLAVGDCLAVALLERKGFSADDFQTRHPGGKLGQNLLKVEDLMHSGEELPLVKGAEPMSDVLITMTAKSFGCVAVVCDEGNLQGIVTDGDLRRNMSSDLLDKPVEDVMTVSPKTIPAGSLAAEAVRIMNTLKITSLFVTEKEKPVGILHIHDCLRSGVF